MDFLWNNPLVGGIVATTGGLLVLSLIPMITKKIFYSVLNKYVTKLESLLLCAEWKEIITMIIEKVQRDLGSEAGKVRKQAVIAYLQALVPVSWLFKKAFDSAIEKIVQTVYDEAKVAKIILK